MLGCESLETALASCSRRWRRLGSEDRFAGSTLTAISRSRRVSRARYTSPMPPVPRSATGVAAGCERSLAGGRPTLYEIREGCPQPAVWDARCGRSTTEKAGTISDNRECHEAHPRCCASLL